MILEGICNFREPVHDYLDVHELLLPGEPGDAAGGQHPREEVQVQPLHVLDQARNHEFVN